MFKWFWKKNALKKIHRAQIIQISNFANKNNKIKITISWIFDCLFFNFCNFFFYYFFEFQSLKINKINVFNSHFIVSFDHSLNTLFLLL